MDKHEFEQFVTEHGKDILRFCRMNAGSTERGNELYQDTMVKLLEKQKKLDAAQNIKSYAMQTAISNITIFSRTLFPSNRSLQSISSENNNSSTVIR